MDAPTGKQEEEDGEEEEKKEGFSSEGSPWREEDVIVSLESSDEGKEAFLKEPRAIPAAEERGSDVPFQFRGSDAYRQAKRGESSQSLGFSVRSLLPGGGEGEEGGGVKEGEGGASRELAELGLFSEEERTSLEGFHGGWSRGEEEGIGEELREAMATSFLEGLLEAPPNLEAPRWVTGEFAGAHGELEWLSREEEQAEGGTPGEVTGPEGRQGFEISKQESETSALALSRAPLQSSRDAAGLQEPPGSIGTIPEASSIGTEAMLHRPLKRVTKASDLLDPETITVDLSFLKSGRQRKGVEAGGVVSSLEAAKTGEESGAREGQEEEGESLEGGLTKNVRRGKKGREEEDLTTIGVVTGRLGVAVGMSTELEGREREGDLARVTRGEVGKEGEGLSGERRDALEGTEMEVEERRRGEEKTGLEAGRGTEGGKAKEGEGDTRRLKEGMALRDARSVARRGGSLRLSSAHAKGGKGAGLPPAPTKRGRGKRKGKEVDLSSTAAPTPQKQETEQKTLQQPPVSLSPTTEVEERTPIGWERTVWQRSEARSSSSPSTSAGETSRVRTAVSQLSVPVMQPGFVVPANMSASELFERFVRSAPRKTPQKSHKRSTASTSSSPSFQSQASSKAEVVTSPFGGRPSTSGLGQESMQLSAVPISSTSIQTESSNSPAIVLRQPVQEYSSESITEGNTALVQAAASFLDRQRMGGREGGNAASEPARKQREDLPPVVEESEDDIKQGKNQES